MKAVLVLGDGSVKEIELEQAKFYLRETSEPPNVVLLGRTKPLPCIRDFRLVSITRHGIAIYVERE